MTVIVNEGIIRHSNGSGSIPHTSTKQNTHIFPAMVNENECGSSSLSKHQQYDQEGILFKCQRKQAS
jgi:hypothetical protein